MTTFQTDVRPWYKERWPWILMAGPGLVVVAGIVTLWLAISSNDGLVTDDYYKQGLAVNQRLQRDQQAGVMGLHADLMRAGLAVRLLIGSAEGGAFPRELTLRLSHPTRSGQDQQVRLDAEGSGFYGGRLSADLTGRWLVSIEDPSGKWRLQGEWQADSAESLHLAAKLQ